jgi:hypothetical protein
MPGNTVHARRTVVGRCGVGRRGVRQRWRAACCAVGAAAPVPRGAWQGCGAELRGQAARPLARMERRVCGVKGRGSAGCIEGPCTGGAHERELGALQRKPRRLHLLARHLHLWCVARRARQRWMHTWANPNRARTRARRDRSRLLARRPQAVELRLGPRLQGVRRSILCHGGESRLTKRSREGVRDTDAPHRNAVVVLARAARGGCLCGRVGSIVLRATFSPAVRRPLRCCSC